MSHLTGEDRQQILNALKRNVNARPGWDLPPQWGAVYRTDTGRMRCRPFAIPAALWHEHGHPKNLLRAYRNFMASPRGAVQRAQAAHIRTTVPDSMVAMYVTTEGWSPPAHKVRAVWEKDKHGEPRERFADMPDRVEMRQASAVDLDSALYLVTQPRPTMTLEGAVDDMSNGATVDGTMPEVMYALLHLFLNEPHKAGR